MMPTLPRTRSTFRGHVVVVVVLVVVVDNNLLLRHIRVSLPFSVQAVCAVEHEGEAFIDIGGTLVCGAIVSVRCPCTEDGQISSFWDGIDNEVVWNSSQCRGSTVQ
eukprot:2964792-Amphidinium_carterae.1